MTANDHRASRRNQILLLAQMRVDGESVCFGIRIRDLSAGGLRAQFAERRLGKVRIAVDIRNIGWVNGSVVWQNDTHIGIRFDTPIDPEKARITVTGSFASPPSPQSVVHRRV